MLPVLIIVFVLLLATAIIVALSRKKSNCSCLNKKCTVDQDCLGSCCDTNVCIQGKCCSTDCSNKSCAQNNSCGQSCSQYVCGEGQACFEGNCCSPVCPSNSCGGDGCGGECKCDPGYTCVTDDQGVKTCCKPPDCTTGYCGSTACGSCSCNDDYCGPEGCCESDQCTYTDICNKNPEFSGILANSWAKFCGTCKNPGDQCNLILPQFYDGSFVPNSGTIQCLSCQGNTIPPGNYTEIDPVYSDYEYDPKQNKIVGRIIGNYCKDSNGKCNGSCVCLTDSDCKAYGCSVCTGGFCK